MARGRMIDNCISISEKINDLSLKEAFIYTWIIPHLDDWGRISGSPRTIKALVFPMKKEISINCIESALTKFRQIGLFLWKNTDVESVLQQPEEEFRSHQSISEGKRAKSKYPEIIEHKNDISQESPRIPQNPPEIPAQVNLREVNLREENIRDIGIDVSKDFKDETSTPEPKINIPISKKIKKDSPNNRIKFDRTLDIRDAKFIGITQGDIDVWMVAYPAVDFTIEVKKAIAWIYGAGAKGYKSKWYSFLNGWFNRCQDRGGSNGRL